MPAPAWEDLDAFLSLDDFGVPAVFIPDKGEGAPRDPVPVIFDEPYFNADLGEYDMSTGEPRVTGKEVDFAGLKKFDVCIVADVRFTLDHDPKPDGTGMAIITMSRDFS